MKGSRLYRPSAPTWDVPWRRAWMDLNVPVTVPATTMKERYYRDRLPADLAWYSISRAADGKIVVNPGKSVPSEDKFLTS